VPEVQLLIAQNNLANSYQAHGQSEQALRLRQDVHSGRLKLMGGEHEYTLVAADNCAMSLLELGRFKEAKSLMRKTIPVAQRVLGKAHLLTIKMRWRCAEALYKDDSATLDDMREAVSTLEEIERTARRVLGGAHPTTKGIEVNLRTTRAALPARDTPSSSA